MTGMVLAALVGAGAAVGTDALLDGGGAAPAAGGSTSSSVIVNDQDEVNAVTAAAVKASPSVVTISASGFISTNALQLPGSLSNAAST